MFLFYYESLYNSEKKIYDQIRNSVENVEQYVELGTAISSDKIVEILQYVLYDSPSLFYVKAEKINIISAIVKKKMILEYLYDNRNILLYKERVINKAKWIISKSCKNKKNSYECIKNLYQYFVSNCSYENNDYLSYTLIGALLEEEAVCQGYAYAFKYILDILQIRNIVVSGTLQGVNHAWNMVWIDNQAYHVDVTAGITTSAEIGINYDYLLVNDDAMKDAYLWDRGFFPICTSTHYSYYTVEGLIVRKFPELIKLLSKFNGLRFVSFKLEGEIKQLFEENEGQMMRQVLDQITGNFNMKVEANYLYQNTVLHLSIKKG